MDSDDSIDVTLKKLNSSKDGLSESQAEERQIKYGLNEIKGKKKNPVIELALRFWGAIPIMLYIVIVTSVFLGKVIDAYIVTGLLVFNAIAGFAEKYKADNTLELLKNKLAVNVKILRDKTWKSIPSKFVVPGDIIRIRMGDVIPADCIIIESDTLTVDESMLTGESLPIEKKEGDKIFSSSIVREGEATAVVNATGVKTNFGQTAQLVNLARGKLHLEDDILKIIKYLVIIDLGLIAAIFITSFLIKINILSVIPFSLLILLTSVPVALPAAFTITMAYGTQRLTSKNILVTKLEAIEEASTMNVVCLDKTGTITKNELSVLTPLPYNNFSEKDVLYYASIASRLEDNDEIDNAIITGFKKNSDENKEEEYSVNKFIPFNPATKLSQSEAVINGKNVKIIKGFPERVVLTAKVSSDYVTKINKDIDELSSKGYRVIAVAINQDNNWKFVGLIPLSDRPREDSMKLISDLKQLGISVKMLTGDSVATAKEIAKEVGIGENILDVKELNGLDEKSLVELVKKSDGFAGVLPKDKYLVVKALQDAGFHVGMTGDGVNDAPALKQAEVGIAVSNATDVAKSAATIVLTSAGIEPIVNAVKESRDIFERIITYTIKKVTWMLQVAFFLSIAFVYLRFLVISALQLILMIFLNDIASIVISTDRESFSKNPDHWDVKVILYSAFIFAGMLLVNSTIIAYIGLTYFHLNHEEFGTMLFVSFIFSVNIMLLSIRARRRFTSSMPSKPVLLQIIGSVSIAAIMGYFGILMPSISIKLIALAAIMAIVFMIITDFLKVYIYKSETEFIDL
jgi:H+-transporting ATPase